MLAYTWVFIQVSRMMWSVPNSAVQDQNSTRAQRAGTLRRAHSLSSGTVLRSLKSVQIPTVFFAFAFASLVQTRPFDELESTVQTEMKNTNTPGVAVAVIRGDAVVFAKGFGVASVETKNPVSTDTLFQIGSLTKVFTSTAVLTAAEAGSLKLNEPVGTYIRNLASCFAKITLDQLLSHTSGIKDEPDEYGPHDEAALSEYIHS